MDLNQNYWTLSTADFEHFLERENEHFLERENVEFQIRTLSVATVFYVKCVTHIMYVFHLMSISDLYLIVKLTENIPIVSYVNVWLET